MVQISEPKSRAIYTVCGEEIINHREMIREGKPHDQALHVQVAVIALAAFTG